MKHMHTGHRNPRLVHCLFATCLLVSLTSHPLRALIGYRINDLFLVVLSVLIVFGLYMSRGRCPLTAIGVALAVMFLGAIGSAVSGIMQQVLIGVAGAGMLIVAFLIHPVLATGRSIRILIRINVLILIGAWIGFVYAYSGGSPIVEVVNPENGQTLRLYLTTFTNSVTSNIIFPAGIFDEPGALAMFSILVVCFNELHDGKRSDSVLILLLSLVTFSVMALLALLGYVTFVFAGARSRRSWVWAAGIVLILVAGYYAAGDIVRARYVDRFVFKDGRFAGDNRTTQVLLFLDMVDSNILLAGAEAFPGVYRKGDQSSNPFSIMYSSGIFVWMPYLLLVVWLLSFAFHRSRNVKFAGVILALLILQRPYVYSMYWGLFINVLLASVYKCNVQSRRRLGPQSCESQDGMESESSCLALEAKPARFSEGLCLQ